MERFLLPTPKKAVPSRLTFKSISSYIKNNVAYIVFVAIYAFINICLFVSRAIEFKDTNIFYILARACGIILIKLTWRIRRCWLQDIKFTGQTLNFNCAFILVLMLRQVITLLRQIGWASFLPLDQHVYLHKACGIVIVFFSVLHTVMHLINFRKPIINTFLC